MFSLHQPLINIAAGNRLPIGPHLAFDFIGRHGRQVLERADLQSLPQPLLLDSANAANLGEIIQSLSDLLASLDSCSNLANAIVSRQAWGAVSQPTCRL